MATKVKPSRLQVSGTPQVGQVPVYVDEDTFQWGAGGGGGGDGDMLKSVYDPDNIEANAFDYNNFINTPTIPAASNTKTFTLSSTSDLVTAQAAYDWYKAGKNPIIVYDNQSYSIYDKTSTKLFLVTLRDTYNRGNSYTTLVHRIMTIFYSSDTVSSITMGTEGWGNVLETRVNYTTPYTPQYNGSPATKKYVDDTASGKVSDAVYGSGWDGVTGVAPSQNAVYDKISAMDTTISSKAADSDVVKLTGNQTIAGTKTFSTSPVVPSKTTAATNTGTAIATEAQVKTVADGVATINGMISSNASSSNKLMDKNYIDDSINSVTAYYITKNAQGDQWATYAELAAATTFYSGGVVRVPTKNDYTIVLDDENHDHATTRYIYNSGWEYQYTINETPLTTAQMNALNSGITSAKVSTYDGYATSKQDTLTAGTGIDITSNTISTLNNFGKSTTAAATVQKEVSIPGIKELHEGQVVHILPSTTSTVANSTLKVNNFTAYPMRYNNAAITTSTDSIVRPANIVTSFVFDGTYWQFIGHGLDSNTTYSNMSATEANAGTSGTTRTISASVLKGAIKTHSPVQSVNGNTGAVITATVVTEAQYGQLTPVNGAIYFIKES